MVKNSKHVRIFKMLQKAEADGVPESDLFDDFESANNTATIKFRLNKYIKGLGLRNFLDDKVIVENGIWYLDKYYWKTTRGEVELIRWTCLPLRP